MSPGVLIDRLINHRLYPLALEICNYLKIPSNAGEVKVLKQWALGKVGRSILFYMITQNYRFKINPYQITRYQE